LQEAEDLTAETYTRAWKTRQQFRGDSSAAMGWLLRIARNLAIDLSRRRKVRGVDENVPVELILDHSLPPEMDVITREQVTILWQMLDTLSDEVREMLVLRYMLGWQVRQIAAHLNMHENTVTVTMKRTLKNLQRDWPQWQEQDHE
jgi:RNA polymerase sigma-70 factor (ECF subfamily)